MSCDPLTGPKVICCLWFAGVVLTGLGLLAYYMSHATSQVRIHYDGEPGNHPLGTQPEESYEFDCTRATPATYRLSFRVLWNHRFSCILKSTRFIRIISPTSGRWPSPTSEGSVEKKTSWIAKDFA